jgi:hypothetical protein
MGRINTKITDKLLNSGWTNKNWQTNKLLNGGWTNITDKLLIKVITKLPNSDQSYKVKVKTHNYINRQNQSTTGKLWKP